MSSANKVGELFKTAGLLLNQMADLTMQIHMSPGQVSPGAHNKSRVKKRPHSESGSNFSQNDIKKSSVVDQKPTLAETPIDQSNITRGSKTNKFSEVTLSALNSPELDVDIEDLDDTSPPGKKMKLGFESDIEASLL